MVALWCVLSSSPSLPTIPTLTRSVEPDTSGWVPAVWTTRSPCFNQPRSRQMLVAVANVDEVRSCGSVTNGVTPQTNWSLQATHGSLVIAKIGAAGRNLLTL